MIEIVVFQIKIRLSTIVNWLAVNPYTDHLKLQYVELVSSE